MSDLSEIRMHNTPDRGVSIDPVGTQPRIIYHVDWEQMGQPTPQMFQDVQDAQVTLATLVNYIEDDEIQAAYDDAIDAVNQLLTVMVESRLESDEQCNNLYMGNLEELPEVEKEVEQRPAGEADD